MSYAFHEVFAKALNVTSPFDSLTDSDIRTAVRNASVGKRRKDKK